MENESAQAVTVEGAQTVILALPEDMEAVFATLLIRELNPDVENLARANEADSTPKLYRAGADYVLALATVSGRMVAADIFPAETAISDSDRTPIVHTLAPKLVG